jgi:hypothetical protein
MGKMGKEGEEEPTGESRNLALAGYFSSENPDSYLVRAAAAALPKEYASR